MKKTYILLFLLVPVISFSQDKPNYKALYDDHCANEKWDLLPPLLAEWKESSPDDPEMFVAYFNYYLEESKQEVVHLDNSPDTDQNLSVQDPDTKETVGFIYSKVHYSDSLFNLAQQSLIDGLIKNPTRLDMYFGRIYSLREHGDLEEHTAEVLNVIELHKKYKTEWLWSNNEPLENPEEMFTGSIQDYNYALFGLNPPYIDGIRKITTAMLELYPKDLRLYSNLGVCELYSDNPSKALDHFNTAHELDPTDAIVVSNIAYTYLQLNDKANATKYYELVIKIGNPELVDFAKQQLETLKEN